MVIAETNDVPDIEPNSQTIIGDSAVIFGGAVAGASAKSSISEPAIGAEATSPDADIDSFFSATSDEPEIEPEITPESREDTLEAGLSPVLEEPVLDSTVILGSAAAGIAGGMVNTIPLRTETEQSSEMGLGLADIPPEPRSYTLEELASVDEDLPELPEGYGDSRIVLLPRDPKWAYAYWDISERAQRRAAASGRSAVSAAALRCDRNRSNLPDAAWDAAAGLRRNGALVVFRNSGERSRLHRRNWLPHRRWPLADALSLCPIRVPPIYPSDWINDQFVTIGFDNSLAGKTFGDLGRQPSALDGDSPVEGLPRFTSELFAMTQGQNALRVAGSLFGSMHQVARQKAPGALSPSGNLSGLNMSGLNVSGLNLSGAGSRSQAQFLAGGRCRADCVWCDRAGCDFEGGRSHYPP